MNYSRTTAATAAAEEISEVPLMSDARRGAHAPDRGATPPRSGWLVVYLLLAPAIILPLWVSLYDRETPKFLSFPFFYWFQFLLIIIAVALTVPAYVLARRLERSDRVAHGLPPVPPAHDAGGTTRAQGATDRPGEDLR